MRRILIVRTDRIGDVIMTTPMIRELRRTYPDAFIATLTQPYTKEIFLHNPHLNIALTDDLASGTFWPTVRMLRSHRFSDALLVWPTERAAWQLFFAGIPNRVGTGHKFYGVVTFMKGVSRNNYTPLRHEADYCMDLARRIGVETDRIAPEIFVSEDEKRGARALLSRKGAQPGAPLVFLHTGTGGSSPNWSEVRYLALLDRLLKDIPDAAIVLTAREMTPEFRRQASTAGGRRIIDISGEIAGVRGLICAIAMADVIITPSTGPEHIADALGVRCVGLHCHRPMNCALYWGVLSGRAANLEVSDEHCRTFCSPDQNTCDIEHGLTPEEVSACAARLLKAAS